MKLSTLLLPILAVAGCWVIPIHPANAASSAVIQNETAWLDATGYYHVTGEVKNTGDTWLHYATTGVRVTGRFLDANGSQVDMVDSFVQVDYLAPGKAGPFDALEFNTTRSAQIVKYSLGLAYQSTTLLTLKLIVQNLSSSRNASGFLTVTGEVQNQGDALSKFTKAVGTFYDAQGKVVAATSAYTDPTDIPPGVTYTFKLALVYPGQAAKVTRYTIVAESQFYSSVPEWPWPTLMLATVVTLATVAVRRKSNQTDSKKVTE
jgi:hypothetical protein